MPKRNNLEETAKEARFRKYHDYKEANVRIGFFYRDITQKERHRFDYVVQMIQEKYKLTEIDHPIELILARQIAFTTIRIEKAERALVEDSSKEYSGKIEKWLFDALKDQRAAMLLLHNLTKGKVKRTKAIKFDDIRNELRKSEELPETQTELQEDGHDRRYYDDITRVS